MINKYIYKSPIGDIFIFEKASYIIGLYFKDKAFTLDTIRYNKSPKIIEAVNWLYEYFSHKKPSIEYLSLNPIGTPFQKLVWNILLEIPYGKTLTYGEVANILKARLNIPKMSPQAVGGAIGKNPISIIIPCHRVIGVNNRLIGYSGGLNIKRSLLKHEGINI